MTDPRPHPHIARIRAAAREVGADWALLTSPDGCAYAGHVAGIETGPSPFDGGPTAVLVGEGLFVTCNELEAALAPEGAEVFAYESLGFADLTPLPEKHAATLGRMLDRAGVRGPVAIEAASLTAAAAELIAGRGGPRAFDGPLARARAIKGPAEVEALRRCAEATAAGQAAVPGAVADGVAELESWREVRLAMEMAAGTRIPVAGDFVSGRERTAAIGGPATDRVMHTGDPVIADLAPRIAGYWGDSATTTVIDEPSSELAEMYRRTVEIMDRVRETLRPGITGHAFDVPLRAMVGAAGYANPVHMGHGIGTSVHEWPRLVPGQKAIIEPGMVLMVEPGCYHPEIGGVRVEQMFLITEGGHEVLSPFDIPHEMPRA